jgi:LysM repeat protein
MLDTERRIFMIFKIILAAAALSTNFLMADSNVSKYSVKNGDCLYNIAGKYYGDNEKWRIIYQANSDVIKNPDLIYPDMNISIPLIESYQNSASPLNVSASTADLKTDVIISSEPLNNDNDLIAVSVSTRVTPLDMDEETDEQNVTDEPETDVKESADEILSVKNTVPLNNETDSGYKNKKDYIYLPEDSLSKKIPLNQSPFNINNKRILVEKDFFDGVVTGIADEKNESTLFTSGDIINISLNKRFLVDDIKNMNIYMVIYDEEENYVAEKVAECVADDIKDNNISCMISASNYPVQKGFSVKVWK